MVTTDMFDTDENDRIIEHWNVIAAYSDEPSANGHTQVDGPTETVDEDKTEANKARIQHNPLLPDGVVLTSRAMGGQSGPSV